MTDLVTTIRGGLLHLHIDRPAKRNALTDELASDICGRLADVPEDVHAVLLSSAGEKAFCSGADLGVMANDATGLAAHEGRGGVRRVVQAMRSAPVPVVVRVHGACLAGGVGLVLGADVVIAAESVEFGLPEVNIGLWPFMVSVLLTEHVSPKAALDLMLTGRRFSAREALGLGLVSRVVADDELDDSVRTLLDDLMGKGPLAMRMGKAAFWQLQAPDLAADLGAMQAQLTLLTQSADAVEGLAAFSQGRAPQWGAR